jgi:hypothetical protein
MKSVPRGSSAFLLALALAACARAPRAAHAPTPAATLSGDYRFTGQGPGVRIGGVIRLDSTGGATLVEDAMRSASVPCSGQSTASRGHLTFACGTVELTLAVANGVIAPDGGVAFDVAKRARRHFDPFACYTDTSNLSCAAWSQEGYSAVVRRYAGKVAVRRIVAD